VAGLTPLTLNTPPPNLIAPTPNLNTAPHSRPFHDLTPDDRDLNFDASARNPENPHCSFGDLALNPSFRDCAPDAPTRKPSNRGLNFEVAVRNPKDRDLSFTVSFTVATLNSDALNLKVQAPSRAASTTSTTVTSASASIPTIRIPADPALNSADRAISVDNLNFLHRILTDGALTLAGRNLDNPNHNPNFRAQNRNHNPTRWPSTSPTPPITPMPPKALIATQRRPHPLLLVSGP
jgi:hypothetical protein